MSDLLLKCEVCRALLDEEDLFCAECGTEAPTKSNPAGRAAVHQSTHNFVCDGCGASMSYDAGAQGLRCPFCGSEKMTPDADTREIAPQGIIPFAVARTQAEGLLRKWLAGSFWSPNDSANAAIVTSLQSIYLPYWVFAAETETYWTADSGATPPGALGNWVPVSGDHRGQYVNNLVCCSSALTPDEMTKINNYDLNGVVPPDQVRLDGITNERFTVPRKYARPMARRGFESRELEACRRYVRGNVRNLRVNVRITESNSYPLLLPVWIVAYRYRDKLYRFIANGQTGAATGIAPISVTKVVGAVAIALVVIGLILAVALFH